MFILTIFTSIFINSSGSVNVFGVIETYLIQNGSTTSISLTNTATTFNFDPLLTAITWIIVITVLAGVVGINVLGSGLNASSSKIIVVATAWSTAYIFFGIYGYPLIVAIPEMWGELLYISLTIVYSIGVFKQIGDS